MALGSGHWQPDGTYVFDDAAGSFTHRHTYVNEVGGCPPPVIGCHEPDGARKGPDALDGPNNPPGGAWSVWIGTNLLMNPENCGWDQIAGQGNGWSTGIMKAFDIDAPVGSEIADPPTLPHTMELFT